LTRHEAHKQLFQQSFLHDQQLQSLMLALGSDADQVRVVGGAVRNALRHIPVSDLDLACVHLPEEVVRRCQQAGFRTVPTGIEHGTVTVVGKGIHFEVTTLREDVQTDGRHALVRFGTDWQRDMERRDFTMNALCVDRFGTLHDLVCGLEDCLTGQVRFIGDAHQRIAEDALRIIRFLRFSAHFGDGHLDAAGLAAANDGVSLLTHLSAERIQAELKKILSAPRSDQLSVVLSDGALVLDAIGLNVDATVHEALRQCERSDWAVRAHIIWRDRIATLLDTMGDLRFSNADVSQIGLLNEVIVFLKPDGPADAFRVRQAAYHFGRDATDDALYLLSRFEPHSQEIYRTWRKPLENWQVPAFPVRAADLMGLGIKPGPVLGHWLSRLEQIWINSQFTTGRDRLLAGVTHQSDTDFDTGKDNDDE
jgi:poly(A) polymerase